MIAPSALSVLSSQSFALPCFSRPQLFFTMVSTSLAVAVGYSPRTTIAISVRYRPLGLLPRHLCSGRRFVLLVQLLGQRDELGHCRRIQLAWRLRHLLLLGKGHKGWGLLKERALAAPAVLAAAAEAAAAAAAAVVVVVAYRTVGAFLLSPGSLSVGRFGVRDAPSAFLAAAIAVSAAALFAFAAATAADAAAAAADGHLVVFAAGVAPRRRDPAGGVA